MFVCEHIYNKWYLRADLPKLCYDEEWMSWLPVSASMIMAYPIGIPLFFWVMLSKNKYRPFEPNIEAKFGFLYAGIVGVCGGLRRWI